MSGPEAELWDVELRNYDRHRAPVAPGYHFPWPKSNRERRITADETPAQGAADAAAKGARRILDEVRERRTGFRLAVFVRCTGPSRSAFGRRWREVLVEVDRSGRCRAIRGGGE